MIPYYRHRKGWYRAYHSSVNRPSPLAAYEQITAGLMAPLRPTC